MLQPAHQRWTVYILRCRDGSLYTGITTDLARRLAEHRTGGAAGARYTRARLPVRLVWWEAQPGRAAAARREAAIKRLTRARKLALIEAARVRSARGGAAGRGGQAGGRGGRRRLTPG